jgi:hypothetical protein
MLKVLLIAAIGLILLMALPLVIAVIAAVWPIAVAAFGVLFPVVALGIVIGYLTKH